MNNLTKVEKKIVDYLVTTNSIDNSFDEAGMQQQNPSNINDLIFVLISDDKLLKDTGLIIDFDIKENMAKAYLMQKKIDVEVLALQDWLLYQRMIFLLTKSLAFINELELQGYIEPIENVYMLHRKRKDIHIPNISMDDYSKTFEISNKELINDLIECLKYYYISTEKMVLFVKNSYKTEEVIILENEVFISKQNIRIAKFGLYTSIFSALISLIAILLTVYNTLKPASIKIDESQVNLLKDSIKVGSKVTTDSIGKFR